MAMKCASCGKGIQVGHNVSHSKRRTRKIWTPNLQSYRMIIGPGSQRIKVKLCVKCLRSAKDIAKKLIQKETISKIQAPVVPKQAIV